MAHGHTANGVRSPTHGTWHNMLERCLNPNNISYSYYGEKGVTVCERWLTFENFLADMGERPAGLTLDRLKSSEGYEKSNCRWANAKEQSRQNQKPITFAGETRSVWEWAEKIGLSPYTLYGRLRVGWSIEKALTTKKRGT
jgi:hypothetical protein